MSVTGRALATVTGHPALKLCLLVVAASPGWPAAGDVAVGAEIPLDLAEDALAELTRLGHLNAHTGTDATRYGLPDDGWTYGRPPAEDELADTAAAAPVPPDVGGYHWTAEDRIARGVSA